MQMPYRRLPTTDKARKRAIEAALRMGETNHAVELAFSQENLELLKEFNMEFELVLKKNKEEQDRQLEKNKAFNEFQHKAKLYLSHFLQIINMAIQRDELKPEVRKHYGLEPSDTGIPPFHNENEILEWGEKVIEGEQQRVNEGGSPIYNPSIALVKVHFTAFKDVSMLHKVLHDDTALVKTGIYQARERADAIIREIWNEVEQHFSHLPPPQKREKAKEYGVVYVLRRKELKALQSTGIQTDLAFDF